MDQRPKLAKRFLKYVDLSDLHGCWAWTGSLQHGYGQLNLKSLSTGKWAPVRANRIAYALFRGRVPEGLHVLHSCDNPKCVRSDHLHLGTDKDNMQEASQRGRIASGDRHGTRTHRDVYLRALEKARESLPNGDDHWMRRRPGCQKGSKNYGSKLNEEKAREIKDRLSGGESQVSIARDYGVHPGTVGHISQGRTWKDA
jgi:hypothetical protein